MTPPNNTSALQVQINSLGERMQQGFNEIKQMLRDYESRTRAIEQLQAGSQPATAANKAVLDDHEKRLACVEKSVDRLLIFYKVSVFIYSALGLSIIALIWSLITGQAEITFK